MISTGDGQFLMTQQGPNIGSAQNCSFMPRTRRAPGGRPLAPRLPPRASRIIRAALERALMEGRNPAAFLAGAAGGTERGERTVRQDLADRGGLKSRRPFFWFGELSLPI